VPTDAKTVKQQRAVLMLLLATSSRALEALQIAENPLDETFVADLERLIERTRQELDALPDLG